MGADLVKPQCILKQGTILYASSKFFKHELKILIMLRIKRHLNQVIHRSAYYINLVFAGRNIQKVNVSKCLKQADKSLNMPKNLNISVKK